MSTRINVNKLQEGLQTKRLGRNIFFCHKVGSTNEWVKELALFGATEGTVAIAETQTAGHGRQGREWFSPAGGLWFSVVLRPKLHASEAVKLVFVSGLAVAEVLSEKYGFSVETKWPNDVLIDGRKICGILAEMNMKDEKVNYAIVGVGVNVNFNADKVFPQEMTKTATSLETELGKKVSLEDLFRALLEKLETVYDSFIKKGFAPILASWKKYAGFLGSQVEVRSGDEKFSGLAVDVDEDGSLVVRLEDGSLKHFVYGDVSQRSS
ncbi:MAG TPA: biotin--[acetyl-CoA-carboxylase] ligase [Candidatus Bathyarchaeia archaeon]|nr:biotin--[acetyl-CoA-carboxylase] ligase [Candidatus Bathyarchaeia archaeon]